MKKVVLMGLCTVLCFQITACGGLGQAVGGKAETAAEKAGSLISDKLESGELLIEGVKYTFPSAMSDWTNNGWHISNNYANIDTFELENNVESTEFEVYNDEKDSEYVTMCAINLERDPVKIEEATVSYLSMDVLDGKNSLKSYFPAESTARVRKRM